MRKGFLRVSGAVVAVVIVALTGSVTKADATTGSWSRCPAGDFCVFTGLNGTGSMATFQYGNADFGSKQFLGKFDNQVRSVWNRSPYPAVLYDQKNFGRDGDYSAFLPCDRAHNLSAGNDKYSYAGKGNMTARASSAVVQRNAPLVHCPK